MGLFDRFRTRDDGNIDLTPQVDDVLLSALLNNETITREKALTLPAVNGAVDFISNVIASMPVKLYKYKQGEVTEQEDDTRVKLLNGDTHDTLDAFQMKKAMVSDYLMGKGGYCYIARDRNEVSGLYYVEDRYITIFKTYEPIHKTYKILVLGNEYEPFEFVKLLRNTKDGASGVGLTVEVSKALETAYQTLLYQLGMVQTGGNKKGFLTSQRKLGQEEINSLKNAWRNLYNNSSENVVVLNNGLEFQEASQSSVEMQMNESKKTLSDEVNNIFHIYDDWDRTYKEAIYPIVKAFETALNRDLLLEKEKKNYFFEFDTKEILRANIKERYEAYKLAKETGFMTLNEIRRMENMNRIEGMDVINVGLGAVLYDVDTHKYYTPNMDTEANIHDEEIMQDHEVIGEAVEDGNIRYNEVHNKDGRFGTSSGGSDSSKGGSGGSSKSDDGDSSKGSGGGSGNSKSKSDDGEEPKKTDNSGGKSSTGKRGQLDSGYSGTVPSAELESFNKKAFESIKKDTGYDDAKAREFHSSLKEYLGGDYESFVNGKQPEKVKAIDDGIAKMPKYDGAVYRGMHLKDSQVEQFRNLSAGDSIEMKACSSWSSNKAVADRYGEQGDKSTNTVLFKCDNNKSGAGVQHVSKWGNTEAEVLLPSTAKWKVKENNTMTKYDYLKDHYTNLAETATKPIHRKIAKQSLEDLEANKDAYMNTTVSVISLEEE